LPVAAAPADADKRERDLDDPQDPLKT
jgi:hypothetical protein